MYYHRITKQSAPFKAGQQVRVCKSRTSEKNVILQHEGTPRSYLVKDENESALRPSPKVMRPSEHILVQHPSRIGNTDTECDVKSDDHHNIDDADQQQGPSSPLVDAHQIPESSPAEEDSEVRTTPDASQTNPTTFTSRSGHYVRKPNKYTS